MKNTEKNKIKWVEKVKDTLILGGRSEKTFDNYKSHIKRFLNYYDENVEINKLSDEDIVEYVKKNYLELNRCAETLNVGICSIKYFYSVCFNRTINKNLLPASKLVKRMPTIITKELFIKIFNEEKCLKYKCWLILAFCSGLRVYEIANLKIENIYPNEHKIKVLGKGNKERYTILPDICIKLLRQYCKTKNITYKTGYLFPGCDGELHISSRTISNYFTIYAKVNNLPKNISFHTLRHSFATYYLINGGEQFILKDMLGHQSLSTTAIYVHLANDFNNLKGINYHDK